MELATLTRAPLGFDCILDNDSLHVSFARFLGGREAFDSKRRGGDVGDGAALRDWTVGRCGESVSCSWPAVLPLLEWLEPLLSLASCVSSSIQDMIFRIE